MDGDDRFLRYAVPGIAVALLLGLALAVARPFEAHAILRSLLQPREPRQSLGAIEWLFAGIVASGGLGFLLAQLYFGLPSWFNCPDHRSALHRRRPEHWLLRPWDDNASRLEAHRDARRIWSVHVAEHHRELEDLTVLAARRMAALGATLVGIVLSFPVWLWALVAHRNVGRGSPWWAALLGSLVLIVPGFLLWRARFKIRDEVERLIESVFSGRYLEAPDALRKKSCGER